jgi:hypothetical protein
VEPSGLDGNTLTVALNTFIGQISVAFATNGPGRLQFTSAAGDLSETSTSQGVGFPGGILSFSSPTPFNLFSLSAGNGPEFAIDNLRLTVSEPAPTPEPATLLLVGAGLVGLSRWRSRRLGV